MQATSPAAPFSGSNRLRQTWLRLARIAWFLIFLLGIWKLVLGTPLIYAEKLVVCTASTEACANSISLSPEEARTLEASGISLQQYAFWAIVFRLFETIVWIGIGILIFCLRTDDWMALIVSAMMILFTSGYASDPINQAYPSVGWLAQLGFSLQNALLFLFIGLFPSGRFAPRWMRWYWIAMVLLALGGENIIAYIIKTSADWLWGPGWLSFLTLGPYSLIYRYRKVYTPTERLQTRWVVFGFTVMAVLIVTGVLLQQMRTLPDFVMQDFFFGLSGLALPISLVVSVLRYRLFDIDVIIRRTLQYTLFSGLLALVYFGAVTVLQSLFTTITGQQSAASLVLSTLAIAALFTPLRRRIQDFIDRRFYRQKYDAEQALAAFAAAARSETEIEKLTSSLVNTIQTTMQPERASLWMNSSAKDIAKSRGNHFS